MKRTAIVLSLMLFGAIVAGAQQPAGELPDLKKTGVVVPWEDFKKILEEIRGPQPTPVPSPPPVDYTMSECRGSAIVSNDERQLRVTLAFTVQVLNPQRWVEVPLIGGNVAMAAARLDGRPAQLYRKNGLHTVALRGAGSRRVELEYLLSVQDSRGTRTARLTFPQAPVVVVDMRVPRAGIDVQVDGAVVQTVERSSSSTRVTAALHRAGETAVSWFPRIEAADRESKVFGELATMVSIGEGVLRGTTTASFTIHGNGVDAFELEIPSAINVLGVNVHGLKGWEVAAIDGEEGRNGLKVELNYLAEGSFGFSFDFEQPLGGTSAEVVLPDIAMRGVLRERGFIAVAAGTNVEITPRDGLSNATPVDPSELPPNLVARDGGAILYAFKHLRHPVVVPLAVIKHLDVAVKRTVVESAQLRTFFSRDGKVLTSARFSVLNNRKQHLAMKLPEGTVLWGAYLEDRPVKAARRADGMTLVPLKMTATDAAGQLRSFSVEVVYFQDEKRLARFGRRSFRAPTLDVDVLEMRWVFFLPRDHWYLRFKGNLVEDETANRIALVGAAAYNLANAAEVRQLGVVNRGGKQYLSDGVNEAVLPEVTVRAAGQERLLNTGELSQLGVTGEKEEDADAFRTEVEPQVPVDELRLGVPDAPPPPRPAGQPAYDVDPRTRNVRLPAGGRARGVLPVRIGVPADGLRLSFTGRLLMADEPPVIAMGYLPANWRLPRLGRWWTAALAFAAVLLLLFVIPFDRAERNLARLLGMVLFALAVLAVYVGAGGHRLAFLVACAAAVGVFALYTASKDRPQTDRGF
jgi:hypothetical protein